MLHTRPLASSPASGPPAPPAPPSRSLPCWLPPRWVLGHGYVLNNEVDCHQWAVAHAFIGPFANDNARDAWAQGHGYIRNDDAAAHRQWTQSS